MFIFSYRTDYRKLLLIFDHMISGNEVVSYERPNPIAGIHRIAFVLFRQSVRQTIYAPGWRQNFYTRDFAQLYNLGPPVAAMYFNCQRENGCGGRRYNNSDSHISHVKEQIKKTLNLIIKPNKHADSTYFFTCIFG